MTNFKPVAFWPTAWDADDRRRRLMEERGSQGITMKEIENLRQQLRQAEERWANQHDKEINERYLDL